MDVDGYTLRERLVARRYNVVTGSEHNLTSKNTAEILVSGALGIHPKDYRSTVEEDVSFSDFTSLFLFFYKKKLRIRNSTYFY